jgi:hypothetical protein
MIKYHRSSKYDNNSLSMEQPKLSKYTLVSQHCPYADSQSQNDGVTKRLRPVTSPILLGLPKTASLLLLSLIPVSVLAGPELEPNNFAPAANSLVNGVETQANLSSSSDQDWFEIDASGGTTITVDFAWDWNYSSDYFQVAILDSAQAILANAATGGDLTLHTTAPTNGTYYVRIQDDDHYKGDMYAIRTTLTSAPPAETEQNNSSTTANSLVSGVEMQAQLSSSSDQDWFEIDASGGTTITVDFAWDWNYSSDYFQVAILDSAQAILANAATGGDLTLHTTAPTNGTYYVRIQDDDHYKGDMYAIRTTLTSAPPAETEQNNSSTTANSLVSGVEMQAQLSSSSDQDWFEIDASGGTTITVDFAWDWNYSSDYFQVAILDSAQAILANAATGGDLTLHTTAPTNGTYYVRIQDDDHYKGDMYAIRTTLTSAPPAETEQNNSSTTANSLVSGVEMQAQLSSSSDQDWFEIDASGGTTITVDFAWDWNYSSDYFQVAILDSAQAILANAATGGDLTLHTTAPTNGTYYVRIQDDDHYKGDMYAIRTTLTSAPPAETEQNNSSTTANSLVSGVEMEAQLSSSSDQDWFEIDASGGTTITVDFAWDWNYSSDYFQVAILDSAQAILANAATGGHLTLYTTAPTNGTYYVRIQDDDHYKGDMYAIRTTLTSAPPAETEQNNSSTTANSLVSGVEMQAQLSSSSDQDWFEIDASGGTTITVDFAWDWNYSSDYFQVAILDSAQAILANAATGGDLTLHATAPTNGTYYVRIQDDDHYKGEMYAIRTEYTFANTDHDRDGVPDFEDNCPADANADLSVTVY